MLERLAPAGADLARCRGWLQANAPELVQDLNELETVARAEE